MTDERQIAEDERCPVCDGAGHLGPATGHSQRFYGLACDNCDGTGWLHNDGTGRDTEAGHTTPDWLWTVFLIIFIGAALRFLGAI